MKIMIELNCVENTMQCFVSLSLKNVVHMTSVFMMVPADKVASVALSVVGTSSPTTTALMVPKAADASAVV